MKRARKPESQTSPAEALWMALEKSPKSTRFCHDGSEPALLPGLVVQGEPVGLPLTPPQAQRLIAQATQAPYGKGTETIVDTKVRRVWQMGTERFRLENPAWEGFIAKIVAQAGAALGVDGKIEASLYKLLVYEKDSFFAPHRDTEKLDRMFATLVVCLPSSHQGGELMIQHDGHTEIIDFSFAGPFEIAYAAFYADCLHEVKPVTEGYRVCLVYNLARQGRKRQPRAPLALDSLDAVRSALGSLLEGRTRLVVPLTHEYTRSSIRRDALKGQDQAIHGLLTRAAESLDCEAHLALLRFAQTCEADYGSYYTSRRRGGSDDDVEIGEIYEESLFAESWRDSDDKSANFGQMALLPDEVMSRGAFEDLPIRQELHEATGNEGVTLERWYHGAAVIIWPRKSRLMNLVLQGPEVAIPELLRTMKDAQARRDGRAASLARSIMTFWEEGQYLDQPSQAPAMLKALDRLGDLEVAGEFILSVLPKNATPECGSRLRKLCERFGWERLRDYLIAMIGAQGPKDGSSLTATVSMLESLFETAATPGSSSQKVGRLLFSELLDLLDRWDEEPPQPAWASRRELRKNVLLALFRGMVRAGAEELTLELAEKALQRPRHYGLHEVLIPTVQELAHSEAASCSGYRALVHDTLRQLRERTAQPVIVPDHWSSPIEAACGPRCQDCAVLLDFLRSPDITELSFRAKEERRKHLRHQIRSHNCDVDVRTEKKGSPYSLICTKNRASYKRRQDEYKRDLSLLTLLDGQL